MSPPLRPAKWNAKAVMRLIAGACARAGAASSPAMMERKILRSVSMMRLPWLSWRQHSRKVERHLLVGWGGRGLICCGQGGGASEVVDGVESGSGLVAATA